MTNINDYLQWRGDLVFSKKNPFNTVDAVILSRFSYLPFYRIKFSKNETIGSATKKLARLQTEDFAWPEDQVFAQLLSKSRRFSSLKVSDYVKHNNPELVKQFSAITVWLNWRTAFISFFGTDGSVFGWKEDFNMTFMESVPAQEEGSLYFRQLSQHKPWRRFYLGGHSKGGNVAVYSAITANDRLQSKIIKVYNLDGPGINKHLAERDTGKSVIPKIESIIPQDSVIGRLLEHVEKISVVESTAKSFYQHDIYSWQVNGDELVPAKITKKSDFNNKVLARWLERATPEQRKAFVDVAFDLLERSKLGGLTEVVMGGMKSVPVLIKSYTEIPRQDRKILIEMLRQFIKSYADTLREK